MNLRTVTCWALYDPMRRQLVAVRQFKYQIERYGGNGAVLLKLKGHYVRKRSSDIEVPE